MNPYQAATDQEMKGCWRLTCGRWLPAHLVPPNPTPGTTVRGPSCDHEDRLDAPWSAPGVLVGRGEGHSDHPDGLERTMAVWSPGMSRATYNRLLRVLFDPRPDK